MLLIRGKPPAVITFPEVFGEILEIKLPFISDMNRVDCSVLS